MHCKNCGVELEPDMQICPLCGLSLNEQDGIPDAPTSEKPAAYPELALNQRQRKFTWEIISIILGSGILAAFTVNFILNHGITWSEYIIAVGLIIFCYASVLSLWKKSILPKLACGFFLSSICLLGLDRITGDISWSLRLAVPLLLCLNMITLIYIKVVRLAAYKGINLIAYAFLAAAVMCLCTENILSLFSNGAWRLSWSLIVSACVLPVVVVLLFVHFRLRKGRNLGRTFHV
ncbi:DUF6320 domain-containing protein [Chitinophaga filiformis]|uniref:DUF6320 domain-containing protein n=1 Tax=Chitinophaga filiformis TaxID=104663 RepID=UPI001F3291B7|nr:DUF6320 domain-containing protein [Chitinophaga filiformis]MCF6407124.1 DUF6320 domain-containing protein [Chitinophaga filiformis]